MNQKKQVAKTTAMLAPISNLIKLHVYVVLKVNTKTKTANQVATNAVPASSTTKQVKAVAKTIAMLAPILTPTKLPV